MGKKLRSRQKVQRSAAARSRAATRVLGSRQPKRRRSRTEVSLARLIAKARRGDFGAREELIDRVLR